MADDMLQPLIEQARAARRHIRVAEASAEAADQAVCDFLKGKDVVVNGYTTGRIANGTVFPADNRLVDQPAKVKAVFYYFNHQYRTHEDSMEIITPDGVVWRLPVTGTKVTLAQVSATSG